MGITRASSERAWMPGSIFQGGYEIQGEIGAGSFGRVYEARQLSTGQKVALKVLQSTAPASGSDGERTRERFVREMSLCAKLVHPNIVTLIDSGTSEAGLLYAVFQLVPGVTLKELLAGEGKLSVAEAVYLMSQVLDALSCAHAQGIVHRDLKPENVMVAKTGVRRNALVLDFGLGGFASELAARDGARLTASRDVMGTPCYAAPEQLRGEPPSVRCDLYSWGLVFLECLTGELAVSGASAQEVIYKQMGAEPVTIPEWLRRHRLGPILAAVTQKQIEKRDATIEALLDALAGINAGETATAATETREAAASERRQISVLCCKLAVASSAGTAVDVEDADEVLHLYRETCAQIAGRAGGTPAGVLADRAAFVFGHPRAHEDDAKRAARAALQIVAETARASARLEGERGLRVAVRLGLHTGPVLVRPLRQAPGRGPGELAGLTPKAAADLADAAPPGVVVASLDTLRLLGGEFAMEAAGELSLPELGSSLAFYRLAEHPQQSRGRDTLASETPLVGRGRQLEELRGAWRQAQEGRPGLVLLRGEPGIGKSRLLRELRRAVPAAAWLQSRCLQESQGSPLRPLADMLAGFDQSLHTLLLRYGFEPEETLPLLASLLGWPADRYPPPALTPERQRERTLDALLLLLLRMAESAPLVFALEDLHWADATTLEFLGLLVQELGTARLAEGPAPQLLAVFTARAEFEPPWAAADVELIQLARLGELEVAEMIGASLGPGTQVRQEVIDEVVRRADGIPLFVEEVARALVVEHRDTGAAARPFQVPFTLRDLLAARLDLLADEARETAHLAAVLGREFRYDLLRAVSPKEEASLRDDLAALQTAGLVFHRRSVRSESYVFKHALVRDAAYDALTRRARQQLHQRVANTFRHRFPELERNRPDILAHHFEHGGQVDVAVDYLHRAGSQSLHRAAHREALAFLDRGLALSRSLEESAGRRRQEVELLSTIGNVQLLSHGYAAAEVEETFRLALQRCIELDDDIPIHVLFGLWASAITRSDRAAVGELLPRFREIIAASTDPVARVTADSALGCGGYWMGEFAEAERRFAEGRALFDSDEFRQFAATYGYGAGIYAFAFGMLNLWNLGYPDQAARVRDEMFRISELARDPYLTAVGLGLGATLAHDRDAPEVELDLADRLLALAVEQRLATWKPAAAVSRGGALLRRGHAQEALPLVVEGIEGFRAIGILCSHSYFLPVLADCYLQLGRLDDAAAVIDQALALCSSLVARPHEPDLLRLRGLVEWQRGEAAAAEATLRAALALSESRGDRGHELRVASDLARLLRTLGRAAEGRERLAAIYGWFTEGFETPDLRDARSLLAEP